MGVDYFIDSGIVFTLEKAAKKFVIGISKKDLNHLINEEIPDILWDYFGDDAQDIINDLNNRVNTFGLKITYFREWLVEITKKLCPEDDRAAQVQHRRR